jgi:hypothetical protein
MEVVDVAFERWDRVPAPTARRTATPSEPAVQADEALASWRGSSPRTPPRALTAADAIWLQRSVGNAAAARILATGPDAAGSAPRQPAQPRRLQRTYAVQSTARTLSTGAAYRSILKRFRTGTWEFPNQASGDGKIDDTTVSRRAALTGPNSEPMAVHATFEISQIDVPAGAGLQTTAVQVHVNNNHLTMRPKKIQDEIDSGGSSAYSAARSIHCNQNGWAWTAAHLAAMQEVTGFSAATQAGLTGVLAGAGHDANGVRTAGREIRKNLMYAVDTTPEAIVVDVVPGNNWQQ